MKKFWTSSWTWAALTISLIAAIFWLSPQIKNTRKEWRNEQFYIHCVESHGGKVIVEDKGPVWHKLFLWGSNRSAQERVVAILLPTVTRKNEDYTAAVLDILGNFKHIESIHFSGSLLDGLNQAPECGIDIDAIKKRYPSLMITVVIT